MVAPKILIRVDASTEIGHGHVHRCLVLADSLKEMGSHVAFIVKDLPGNANSKIYKKEYKIFSLKANDSESDYQQTIHIINNAKSQYDWIIVDHYSLDELWEKALYETGIKVFVIDDLASNKHYCHYLLNQTFELSPQAYHGKINKAARLLVGEQYILLHKEFSAMRQKVILAQKKDNFKVHMFWGSTDPFHYTYQYSKILLERMKHLNLKIIVGSCHDKRLDTLKERYPEKLEIFKNTQSMAQTMLNCDLALGAPGMTTWERATMGLPSLYLATNKNQISILKKLHEKKFCFYLGEAEDTDEQKFIEKLTSVISEPKLLYNMAKLGFNRIDAKGANRVANIIMDHQ